MRAAIKTIFCFLLFVPIAIQSNGDPLGNEYTIRKSPEEKINKYLSDKDFSYDRNQYIPVSPWSIIGQWFVKWLLRPVAKNIPVTFWEIIKYLIIAVAAGLFIYYVINGNRIGLFARNAGSVTISGQHSEEDLYSMEFNELIRQAVERKDFKVAVRYLFLRSLKELSDNNLIIRKPEKTNFDYLKELQSSSFEKPFGEITWSFEYAWYGNAQLNENSFMEIKMSFDQFSQQLQPQK